VEGVVIDTNVFVVAGFNSKSAAARVFEGVREGRFRLIWNEPTRRETEIIVRRFRASIGQASPISSSRKRNLPGRSILRRSPQSQTPTIENSQR
jgi:predicted nucleic acid-binding protein